MPEEKYIIPRERKDMLTPGHWNGISQSSPIMARLYKINTLKMWNLGGLGKGNVYFLKRDWNRAEKLISEQMFKNKNYFLKIKRRVDISAKMIERFLKIIKNSNFSELNFEELITLSKRIKNLWLDYDMACMPAWHIGGNRFKNLVGGLLNLPEEEFLFLTTPVKKTAVSQLDYDLLKYLRLIREKKIKIETAANKLSDAYGWIPFGYDGPTYWDKKYFFKKLKNRQGISSERLTDELKGKERNDENNFKRRKALLKKYRLSKEQIRLIKIINTLAVWTDERKRLQSNLHCQYSRVLWEMERRYDVPYKNLKYLFTEELKEVASDRTRVLKKTDRRLHNDLMLEFKKGQINILSENKKKNILKEIENQTKQSIQKEIKGAVASQGPKEIYQGKVKVLSSPKESNKIRNGEFLVATMTTPQYIIAMKKAAGFITDEGGVTCHAAIVAREMNKPCIIGTKIATKVLKDGDFVEVNANRGVVKILKRAG